MCDHFGVYNENFTKLQMKLINSIKVNNFAKEKSIYEKYKGFNAIKLCNVDLACNITNGIKKYIFLVSMKYEYYVIMLSYHALSGVTSSQELDNYYIQDKILL